MADRRSNSEARLVEGSGVTRQTCTRSTWRNDRERVVGKLRIVWNNRQFILRMTLIGIVLSTFVAFVIPNRFESITCLMPPDQMSSSLMMLAGAAGQGSALGGATGSAAGDLLGLKDSGDLFVGVLQSRTVQDEDD